MNAENCRDFRYLSQQGLRMHVEQWLIWQTPGIEAGKWSKKGFRIRNTDNASQQMMIRLSSMLCIEGRKWRSHGTVESIHTCNRVSGDNGKLVWKQKSFISVRTIGQARYSSNMCRTFRRTTANEHTLRRFREKIKETPAIIIKTLQTIHKRNKQLQHNGKRHRHTMAWTWHNKLWKGGQWKGSERKRERGRESSKQ